MMMLSVAVVGVEARVLVDTSLSAALNDDQRSQQLLKKLHRRRRLNSSYNEHNDDDRDDSLQEDVDVTPSLLSVTTERQRGGISAQRTSPSERVDFVVPDVSRLDFIRRFPVAAESRRLRGPRTGHSGRAETADSLADKLRSSDADTAVLSRMTWSRSDQRTGSSSSGVSSVGGRHWRIAVLVGVVTCFITGLLLTLVASVWMRRRRRSRIQTAAFLDK